MEGLFSGMEINYIIGALIMLFMIMMMLLSLFGSWFRERQRKKEEQGNQHN